MSSQRDSRVSHSQTSAAAGAGGPQNEHGQDPIQREQDVNQQGGGNQGEAPLPPPPPFGDLAKAISNQTLILEALANVLVNKRPREQTMNDKLTVFLRTKPPTFVRSNNPLEADDWLRVIQRKLAIRMPRPRQGSSGSSPTHRNCLSLVGELLCRCRRCHHHHLG